MPTILGFTTARNSRTGADFFLSAYDCTGIAADGPQGSCTLISDTFAVTAAHLGGGYVGAGVIFWLDNEGQNTVEYYVISLTRIVADSDVALIQLSSTPGGSPTPLPAGIKRHKIGSGYANMRGLEVIPNVNTEFGRNVVNTLYDQPNIPDGSGGGYKEEFQCNYDTGAGGFNPDEFLAVHGDSGSTVLVAMNGELVLVAEVHDAGFNFSGFGSVSAPDILSAVTTFVEAAGDTITSVALVNPVPTQVQGLTITAIGSGGLTLGWTAEPHSTGGYIIYRGTSTGTEVQVATVSDVNTQTYTDTGLTNGTTYFYKVAGTNDAGAGSQSAEQSASPVLGAPTITGVQKGNGRAFLQWTDPGGAGITGYKVYRGTTSGGESFLATTTSTFINDGPGLVNGTPYFYKVSAVDNTGEGPLSSEVSVTPSSGGLVISYLDLLCDPVNGSNTQPGDNTATPVVTTNGAYTQGGGASGNDRYVAASGTPFAAAVAGQLVAFMADAGTIATQISRILVVNSPTSIDIGSGSTLSMLGVRTATTASGITATINGPMKGPSGTISFPLNLTNLGSMQDANGNGVWVNLRNNAIYQMTAALTASNGPYGISGYSSSLRDGGRAIIDGGTSGTSYNLYTSGSTVEHEDLEFRNNGATGSGVVVAPSNNSIFRRCSMHDGVGLVVEIVSNQSAMFESCDIYNGGKAAAGAGFVLASGNCSVILRNCRIHDNTGYGIDVSPSTGRLFLVGCNIYNNTLDGGICTAGTLLMDGCDFYNNAQSGFNIGNTVQNSSIYIRNSNFGLNTTAGIRFTGTIQPLIVIENCGFCTGSFANGTDILAVTIGKIDNYIQYVSPVHPWRNPTQGDFTIVSPQAIGQGAGNFLSTKAGDLGQTSYPTIGSNEPLRSSSGRGFQVNGH